MLEGYSNLIGWPGWHLCRHPSYFVGLLLKEARLPYNNYGHVVLAKPSPILFYPISSVEVSLLLPPDNHNRQKRPALAALQSSCPVLPCIVEPQRCVRLPYCASKGAMRDAQVRCLVDIPGEKLPSQVSGALSEYLTSHVANEVRPLSKDGSLGILKAICRWNVLCKAGQHAHAWGIPTMNLSISHEW